MSKRCSKANKNSSYTTIDFGQNIWSQYEVNPMKKRKKKNSLGKKLRNAKNRSKIFIFRSLKLTERLTKSKNKAMRKERVCFVKKIV